MLRADVREEIYRLHGSTTARNALDWGSVPLSVVDYVERLEEKFAALIGAESLQEEPMKYADCHVMHHVLKSALENKGVTLNRSMVRQLAAEIRDMVKRPNPCADEKEDLFEPYGEEEHSVDAQGVKTLTDLVKLVIDKPLTRWQLNQLERWDDLLRKDPPDTPIVLDVPESEEKKEKRHQIGKIMQVAGCSEARAKTMYDDGIRLVDMPYDSDA